MVHLQLAAQVGLAVLALVDAPGSARRGRWREVAATVAHLCGIPPTDTARDVAGELCEALYWLRGRIDRGDAAAVRAELRPLADRLPVVASTLHRGLDRALSTKSLFLPDTVLQRPAGSLVYRAVEKWRPATRFDALARDLSQALWRLASRETAVPAPATGADTSLRRAQSATPGSARPGPRPRR